MQELTHKESSEAATEVAGPIGGGYLDSGATLGDSLEDGKSGKSEQLDAAREADRTWQAKRKGYLEHMIPRILGIYLPLVSILGAIAWVYASRVGEGVAATVFRLFGLSRAVGSGWEWDVYSGILSVAFTVLAMLLNFRVTDRLARWQQRLKQELDTYPADEHARSKDYRSIDERTT